MSLSLILPNSLRRNLLLIGAGLVIAVGCNGPVSTDITIEEPSCIDGALSMTYTVSSTNSLILPQYQGGSANVSGFPTVLSGVNQFNVIADLTGAALNEPVTMKFSAVATINAQIVVSNVQFYNVPVAQLPQPPMCPPTQGPVIGTNDLPGLGFHMTVENPTPAPIILQMLELVESPSILPNSAMEWGNPTLESLPWVAPIAPGTVLLGGPPLVIDLPDTPAPSTQATLLRYTALYDGRLHRVIVQGDLVGEVVKTEQTTWGKVKSLYSGK